MDKTDYEKFFAEFMGESDRAAIVLGAAQMDDLLETILYKRLIEPKQELFDFNGPYGTFSAKIDTAHAVGVLDKSFATKIHLVRKIRNQCAHDIQKVDLNKEPVSQQIADLAASFSDTEFWRVNIEKSGVLFNKTGNSLILRFAIACLVANLAQISSSVKTIDGALAHHVFIPRK